MNRRLVLLALACSLVSAGWPAAEERSIVGIWDCVSTTPTGVDMNWTLTVNEQNGKLTGIAGSDEGEMPITDARLENGVFSFKVLMNSEPYSVQLKISGTSFHGTWTGGGETGTIKGTKKKP